MSNIINIDTKSFNAVLGDFAGITGKVDGALSKAINRAASSARAELIRQVTDEYTVKTTRVRQTLRVKRSTKNSLKASILSLGAPIQLVNFEVSPSTVNPRRRTPLKVSVRQGSKKTVPGIFFARDLNGKKRIFERSGNFHIASRGNHSGQRREILEAKFGPSVPQMADDENIVSAISEKATDVLQDRIDHEVTRLFGGR